MNKIFLIIAAIFMLSTVAHPIYAQCLTDVDGTTSVATNVTTGTNVQISVTPSGSCSSGEINSLQLTYSNCTLTVNDPASPGYYTGVSTGSAKTFTVTSGSAGICTITARGTTSEGSVDDNTPVILEFVDPATLTLEGAPISKTVTHGNRFNLSINVTNPQPGGILTSYTLKIPSGLTKLSGDPTSSSSTTVSGSGTKVLDWTINHSTCFTGTKTVTFQLGDNNDAFSTSIAGSGSCGSSNSSSDDSSSSSSGGTNSTSTTKETKLFSTTANAPETVSFSVITSAGLTDIILTTNSDKASVKLSLEESEKPSAAGDPISGGVVYKFFDITKENLLNADITSAVMKFRVPVSWLNTNNINRSTIKMFRFVVDKWEDLGATETSSDSSYHYYDATTPGFSTFVIIGEKLPASATTTSSSGPSIIFISPADDAVILGPDITTQISAAGITLVPPTGTAVDGEGHLHVWLDDANEQISENTTFTFANVTEGKHTLRAELRKGDHTQFSPSVSASVTFNVTYDPGEVTTNGAFYADYTLIAIVVVIIAIIAGGAFSMMKKGIKLKNPLNSIKNPMKFKFKQKFRSSKKYDFNDQHNTDEDDDYYTDEDYGSDEVDDSDTDDDGADKNAGDITS